MMDYVDLHNCYERERAAELERLPECDECGEPIQEEVFFEFDGLTICCNCLKQNHRKFTEDYID